VNTIHYPLDGKVRFHGISSGSRLLALHTDADLPGRWQKNDWRSDPQAFQAGANVHLLARGKAVTKLAERARCALPQAPAGGGEFDLPPEQTARCPGATACAQAVHQCRALWREFERKQDQRFQAVAGDLEKVMQTEAQRLRRSGQAEQGLLIQYALEALRKGEPADFSAIRSPLVRKAKDLRDAAMLRLDEEYEADRARCHAQYAKKMQAALKVWKATVETALQEARQSGAAAHANDLSRLKSALDAELNAFVKPTP